MEKEKQRIGRNHELKLKLGKEERRRLQQKADALSLKLSQYIRMCSLNAKVKID